MLNYILPPIIIIISISVLIMFLFRKADQVPAHHFDLEERIKSDEKKLKKLLAAIGGFSLKMLERMMHRSKLWSLQLHNASNVWFQKIREKRQRDARIQKENEERNAQLEKEAASNVENSKSNQEDSAPAKSEKKSLRPMVSAGMTMPQQTKVKEKNKMEEALIRRIAINPKDIEAYERLGDYYLESQNFQDSLECFKQVLKLSPTHHKARLQIRRLERMR